jgi:hypothetical protein
VTQAALAEAETPTEDVLFSTYQVARLTGASQQQLHRWCWQGYIIGMRRQIGTGNERLWTSNMVETARDLYAASKLCGHGGAVDLPKLADFVRRAAEAGIFP